MLNFEAVWNMYLTHYAPTKVAPHIPHPCKTPITAGSLLEIKDAYDVLLLDGFGVLNVGNTAIPNMPEIITTLKNEGKAIFILTNGGSQASYMNAKKYPLLGYPITRDYVISSRDALEEHLKKHLITLNQGTWGVMSMPECQIDELPAHCIVLDDSNMDYVDGFLFLGTSLWTPERQEKLIESLSKKQRPILVGNPDISAPFETSFSIEAGYYSIALNALKGSDVQFFGKPFQNAYEVSIARIQSIMGTIDSSRILMVGDTPHTDILGGNLAGMKTALMIDWGFLRQKNPLPFLKQAGISPDFIITQTPEILTES